MIKVDGQFIVGAACNNGSTALITRDGELLMFGKDTTHTDHATGKLYCNFIILNSSSKSFNFIRYTKPLCCRTSSQLKGRVYHPSSFRKGSCCSSK